MNSSLLVVAKRNPSNQSHVDRNFSPPKTSKSASGGPIQDPISPPNPEYKAWKINCDDKKGDIIKKLSNKVSEEDPRNFWSYGNWVKPRLDLKDFGREWVVETRMGLYGIFNKILLFMGRTIRKFPFSVMEKGTTTCGITLDWSSEVAQEYRLEYSLYTWLKNQVLIEISIGCKISFFCCIFSGK